MNKNMKKTLAPTLRFSEFRDAKEWVAKPLSGLYAFKVTNSYSRDMLNYEKGSVKNIHYGDIHTKFSTLFDIQNEIVPFINSSESLEKIREECYCIEGDMVFADASEDLADVGKSIEILDLNNERLLSGLHTLLARQKEKKLVLGFGGHLFKSSHIRKQIQKESQGAKVLGISAGRLSGIEVFYPSDKEEQQKIADCLSSIDALISAQSQKIEFLKTHKKSLTQQLFPREGETIPRLRFHEFLNAGEWQMKKLRDAIDPVVREVAKPNSNYLALGIRSHGRGTFQKPDQAPEKNAMDTLYLVNRDDLIVNITFAWEGAIAIAGHTDHGCHVSHRFPTYVFKSLISTPEFFRFVINQKSFFYKLGQISPGGAGRNRVMNKKDFLEIPVNLPSLKEQQKIADCLSSIDALISAYSQKLETLKAHKKGLMQALFPVGHEVGA